MATNYNYFGNLVTSGLVLDLDAAKVASYPGTGTTWYDISGNNYSGSLTNGPTFTGIGKQAAIVFDGTDDYVGVTNPITNPTTLTISVAHKPSIQSNPGIIVGYRNTSTELIQITQQTPTSSLLQIRGSGNVLLNISQSNALNTTTILTGVFNRTTGIHTLYQNASPSSNTLDLTSQTLSATALNLGTTNNGSSLIAPYSGSIYSTQVYNRALSQFEVWQNFNAIKGRYGIPDIVTNGLVLNLDAGNPYSYLSGSSGTTWTNTVAVSSSISGTLVNGTSYSNGSMVFDGTNDYVDCSLLSNLFSNTSQNLTYSFWIKPTSISTIRILFNVFTTGFNGGRVFTLINTAGTYSIQAALYISASPSNRAEIACNIPNIMGTWANFSIVWDGSNYAIYMNGSELTYSSRTTLSSSATGLGNSPVRIGADNNLFNPTFLGNISNTQIYNRVLSAAEITQNFNALRGRYGI
jgi:hypothetical protein